MENCSHNTFIRIRTNDELKDKFKEYCTDKDTTMSELLISHITGLLSKNGNGLPPEEKNSVKEEKLKYCNCGMDLLPLSTEERTAHRKTCKACQNK